MLYAESTRQQWTKSAIFGSTKKKKWRVLIFGKIMVQVRVFVGKKINWNTFQNPSMHPNRVWINYKISQILQFLNFSIFIQNPIWTHRQVLKHVPIDFSPTKTLTWTIILPKIRIWFFAIFFFFVEPKMALFVHCWQIDSAYYIICNQRKYCQIFKLIWIPFEGEIASKLC